MQIRSRCLAALIGAGTIVAGGLGSSGCVSMGGAGPAARAIPALLDEQARAWNEGDTSRFMQAYWKSPQLTFSSGGKVTRGWQATLDNYRRRYPTREDMGHLTFGDLEVFPLGAAAALVLGRWKLERTEPVGGNFTLVLRLQGGRWVIIHDHTSRDGG